MHVVVFRFIHKHDYCTGTSSAVGDIVKGFSLLSDGKVTSVTLCILTQRGNVSFLCFFNFSFNERHRSRWLFQLRAIIATKKPSCEVLSDRSTGVHALITAKVDELKALMRQ